MTFLILLRHGESMWNAHNRFTGWVDLPLSKKGIDEALSAGTLLKELPIDLIFTSTLVRAMMTAMIAMSVHSGGKVPILRLPIREQGEPIEHLGWSALHDPTAEAESIPVIASWHLNERMYGDLQGLNKAEMVARYGKEQVQLWRRSYRTAPPHGESLEATAARTLPYFREEILPQIVAGKQVLIAAHGNSLRSIAMFLDNLSEEEVVHFEIPTGTPLFYEYKNGTFCKKRVEELSSFNHSSTS